MVGRYFFNHVHTKTKYFHMRRKILDLSDTISTQRKFLDPLHSLDFAINFLYVFKFISQLAWTSLLVVWLYINIYTLMLLQFNWRDSKWFSMRLSVRSNSGKASLRPNASLLHSKGWGFYVDSGFEDLWKTDLCRLRLDCLQTCSTLPLEAVAVQLVSQIPTNEGLPPLLLSYLCLLQHHAIHRRNSFALWWFLAPWFCWGDEGFTNLKVKCCNGLSLLTSADVLNYYHLQLSLCWWQWSDLRRLTLASHVWIDWLGLPCLGPGKIKSWMKTYAIYLNDGEQGVQARSSIWYVFDLDLERSCILLWCYWSTQR